jgi:hypothetical protein
LFPVVDLGWHPTIQSHGRETSTGGRETSTGCTCSTTCGLDNCIYGELRPCQRAGRLPGQAGPLVADLPEATRDRIRHFQAAARSRNTSAAYGRPTNMIHAAPPG